MKRNLVSKKYGYSFCLNNCILITIIYYNKDNNKKIVTKINYGYGRKADWLENFI